MEEIWRDRPAVVKRQLAAERTNLQELRYQNRISPNDTIPRYLYGDWGNGPFMQGGDWTPPSQQKEKSFTCVKSIQAKNNLTLNKELPIYWLLSRKNQITIGLRKRF